MKLYKLTRNRGGNTTRNGMQWGKGITNTKSYTSRPQLCTSDVIHAYLHPLQMMLNRSGHGYGRHDGAITVWQAEGEVVVQDDGKVGVFSLTTIEPIRVRTTLTGRQQRVASKLIAIVMAQRVPLGHPRTGSAPIKAIRAMVKQFLVDFRPPWDMGSLMNRCSPKNRRIAMDYHDAMRYGTRKRDAAPLTQEEWETVWGHLQRYIALEKGRRAERLR